MNKNKRFATFEKHYATFRVNQKTYYDNVKEITSSPKSILFCDFEELLKVDFYSFLL